MRKQIYKNDSKITRQAKRSFNDTLRKKRNKQNLAVTKTVTRSRREFIEEAIEHSEPIEHFCNINNLDGWGRGTNSILHLKSSYTLFEKPDKVLKMLLSIFGLAKFYAEFPTIVVDGRAPFGALYLIDNICWEIAKSRQWGVKFHKMGDQDREILSKIQSNLSSEYHDDKAYMINEKVNINRAPDGLAVQPYKKKSRDITEMVKLGMREHSSPDFDLSPEEYQAISSTIGEHFDNIYSHVPTAEHGYLCGFYDKEQKSITILVFNFGATIAETLESKKLPEHVQVEIDKVLDNHTRKRLFRTTFTQSNALTLLAIQEGISSKLTTDKSRGHGIMDYIEHCFNLSDKCKIAIISGDTAICIDNKYQLGKKFFIDRERRILAFNDENDIYSSPDPDYVKKLKATFNGVIIETTIPLCDNE